MILSFLTRIHGGVWPLGFLFQKSCFLLDLVAPVCFATSQSASREVAHASQGGTRDAGAQERPKPSRGADRKRPQAFE